MLSGAVTASPSGVEVENSVAQSILIKIFRERACRV
jgi:hypothetical protein